MNKRNLKLSIIIVLTLFIILFTFSSCYSVPASATSSGPRTIILDGKTYSADDYGGFITWYCTDRYDTLSDTVLVEVGYFGDKEYEGLGFVLFDGGYTGTLTRFGRDGLDRKWYWGINNEYIFILKDSKLGFFYDFTNVPLGESSKPRSIYNAHTW